ncbi:MAG TPA: sigma-70 family RNA polymerase sigma factor [Polyangia bacterium]|nr:sigma-70 family RNA polymerase sigma factor [Polyangia bacterium]
MAAYGDTAIGEMLVDSLPTLWAFIRRRVADHDTANDILQEVSLRALAGEGPRDPSSFVAWSCGIAPHVIGLEWRRRRRLRERQPLEALLLDDIRDPVPTPDRLCDARASLERAMGAGGERVALLLRRHLDNVTGKELAQELGLSPAALRMRLMRTRSRARRNHT